MQYSHRAPTVCDFHGAEKRSRMQHKVCNGDGSDDGDELRWSVTATQRGTQSVFTHHSSHLNRRSSASTVAGLNTENEPQISISIPIYAISEYSNPRISILPSYRWTSMRRNLDTIDYEEPEVRMAGVFSGHLINQYNLNSPFKPPLSRMVQCPSTRTCTAGRRRSFSFGNDSSFVNDSMSDESAHKLTSLQVKQKLGPEHL